MTDLLATINTKAAEGSLSLGDGIAAAGVSLGMGIFLGLACLGAGIALGGLFRS